MANEEHLILIRQGVDFWNKWRSEHAETRLDLSDTDLRDTDLRGADLHWTDLHGADLHGAILRRAILRWADLSGADLRWATLGVDLHGANLHGANLHKADLSGANLEGADLSGANISEAKIRGANLSGAKIFEANLYKAILEKAILRGADLSYTNLLHADLEGADLEGADLRVTTLVEANLKNANLNGCKIFGISAWNLKVNQGTKQSKLIITDLNEATVTVDDLEVAQFIYLLLNREKLRKVLDTITTKAVLLLGRFTAERKAVLDALADELRKHNLLPIIFDFERSTNRDFTETIKVLAGLSLFVIVDITKPKSAPQELTATVPDYQIPFVPILEEGEDPYSMFVDFKKYDWVLKPVLKYRTKEALLENFRSVILDRAWKKHLELQRKKNEQLEAISIEDMIDQEKESVL